RARRARRVATADSIATRTARLTWEQTTLPRLIRRLGVDVLHSPHYTTALANPAASVVTLHDATFFTDPMLHHSIKARFFRAWTKTSLARPSLCVVPGDATGGEWVGGAGAEARGLEIIQHGVASERFPPPSPGEVSSARRLVGVTGTPYVAFLGALEPRKNVPALIRGFAAA